MIKGDDFRHMSDLGIKDYIVIGMSIILSGIGSFIRRDITELELKKKLMVLLTDLIGSVSIGTTVFLVVYGYTDNLVFASGVASFFGHVGTRGIYLMEMVLAEKLKSSKMEEEVKRYYEKNENE